VGGQVRFAGILWAAKRFSIVAGRQGCWPFAPQEGLPGADFNGIIKMLGIHRASLEVFRKRMKRILLHLPRLLTLGVLSLLAGVVILSAATREPCLRARTGPWHTWKSGHMVKPDGQEASKLRVAVEAHSSHARPIESPALVLSIPFPPEEAISPANSIILQVRHLRAPPALGLSLFRSDS